MTEPLVPAPDESSGHDAPTESLLTKSHPNQVARSSDGLDLPSHPQTIGPYRIIRLLGEGGMGSVFLAEQHAPVHRQVALKIVKLGMDTRQTIARFNLERETLAMMSHSGVARVYDAGVSEQGHPYFVMEYVDGSPITTYCDRHQLSTNERLQLFVQVCRAVQHAHQKGVIHRDIKPSNVLIAEEDGRPIPKVIDFGIAKATQRNLTEQTLFTEQGQFIGTPGYMSPEQAGWNAQDIDTRADVYALGVLLYELLVGTRPFDDRMLRRAGLAEMQRIICEIDPPKPSTRFSEMGEVATQIATWRRCERRTLCRMLRADLDWVVMKCLEKDRGRRYDAANDLAMDVERFLQNEPVMAGPPSASYRLRKLVRRHRLAVAALLSIVIALTLGLGAALWGMAVARQQQVRAESARLAEEERSRELEQVVAFQEEQLAGIDVPAMGIQLRDQLREALRHVKFQEFIDPSELQKIGESLIDQADLTGTVLSLLDSHIFERALSAIDKQFITQPVVRAQLLQATARTARRLGLLDRAVAPQRSAWAIRRDSLDSDDEQTLRSANEMSLLLQQQGSSEEALSLFTETLATQRRVLGDHHPDTLNTIHNLGALLREMGRYDESEDLLREALAGSRQVHGNGAKETLTVLNTLGLLLANQARFSEAEEVYEEALAGRSRLLGERHMDTLLTKNNMAGMLADQGRFAEAETIFREVWLSERATLGADHPSTLASISNVGWSMQNQGKLAEAEPLLLEALESKRRKLGPAHPSTLISLNNYASLLQKQGRLEEAEPLYRENFQRSRAAFDREHPLALGSALNLSHLLDRRGKYSESIALFQVYEDSIRRAWTDSHPKRLGGFLSGIGEARTAMNEFDDAEDYLLEAYCLLTWDDASGDPALVKCLERLIALYEKWHAHAPDAGHGLQAESWRARYQDLTVDPK